MELLPVIVLTVFVCVFGAILILVGCLFGEKVAPNETKRGTYECGVEVAATDSTKVPIKYYLTAILFILFDIEIIFMYPWAIAYGDFISNGSGAYIFGAMAFFLAVFSFGLFWEIKSKALEWE